MSQYPVVLFQELKSLIQTAKQRAAVAVNAELTLLYWQVGQRIASEILKGERAEYGKEIIPQLSKQLTAEFGRGWSAPQLRHCLRFAEAFADPQIVSTLSRQLHWSHFLELIYLKDALARQFYIELCTLERWNAGLYAPGTPTPERGRERMTLRSGPKIVGFRTLVYTNNRLEFGGPHD